MRGILVLFALAYLLMKRGVDEIRFKRKYSSYPISKIRSLSVGRVKVRGKLKALNDLSYQLAELSNQKCLMYIYEIDIYRYGYIKRGYQEVFYSGDWGKFMIEDETGKIMIVSENIHGRLLKPKYTYKQNIFRKFPKGFEKFLSRHDIQTKSRFGLRRAIRIREYQLNENDIANLVGYAEIKTDELRNNSDDHNLYLTGSDQFSLVFTQTDKKLFNEFISSLWFLLGAGLLILGLVGFMVKFK
jgi:preprotein translocase subunit Sss1